MRGSDSCNDAQIRQLTAISLSQRAQDSAQWPKDVFQVIDSTNRFIDHDSSHRTRFGEYGVSNILGKRFWRQHVNRDTQ
jgi:hypothetical protein